MHARPHGSKDDHITFLPSWGKEESYELLIRHYIGEEKWAAAKKYHRLGMEELPNSYLLTALSKKLEGK